MATPSAAASGTFKIGGDLEVHRLGFGAMRITGDGIWGPPDDHDEAIAVLRRLPELGVDFIDTADSYGPYVSEDLIREALHPYDGIRVATKGGLTRHGPNVWPPVGRPEYLRQCALMSLRRLGVERIDLWQLHRIDPKVPRDEQFGVHQGAPGRGQGPPPRPVARSRVEEIKAAAGGLRGRHRAEPLQPHQPQVRGRARATASSRASASSRGSRWPPASWPSPAARSPRSRRRTTRRRPGRAGVAARAQSPVMLPIPGTGSVEHLEENVAAADLELSDEELATLDRAAA